MRVWKQVGVSVAVVGAGLCLWGFYSPEARNVLASMGLGKTPASAVEVAAATPGSGQNAGGARRNGNATLVVTAPVKKGTVNDRLNAIGNGEAIQSVVVMPQASGTLSEIRTSSGARVVKGQVLARLDDEEQVIERDKAQVALRSAVET